MKFSRRAIVFLLLLHCTAKATIKLFNVSNSDSNEFCGDVFTGYVPVSEQQCRSYSVEKGLEFVRSLPVMQVNASGCFEVPKPTGGRHVVFARSAFGDDLGCPSYQTQKIVYKREYGTNVVPDGTCSSDVTSSSACELNECCSTIHGSDMYTCNDSSLLLSRFSSNNCTLAGSTQGFTHSSWKEECFDFLVGEFPGFQSIAVNNPCIDPLESYVTCVCVYEPEQPPSYPPLPPTSLNHPPPYRRFHRISNDHPAPSPLLMNLLLHS